VLKKRTRAHQLYYPAAPRVYQGLTSETHDATVVVVVVVY